MSRRNAVQLAAIFRTIIVANELDGQLDLALTFSDPDGVRSGKSGWSFGVCQFDLSNNALAATCLSECGFTAAEIHNLKVQNCDVSALIPKLKAGAAVIERYDELQLSNCLTRAQRILAEYGIVDADDAALLSVADYDNQYYLSDKNAPGYLVHYLVGLGRPFTADDVLTFKVEYTTYGKRRPEDCHRRYRNLIRIVRG